MTTSHTSKLVSVAAVTTLLLAAGGCAASSQPGAGQTAPATARHRVVPFENTTRDVVQVYLVSEQREWFLGRVEEGARVALRLPQESLAADAGLMRLVVLMGDQPSQPAAHDPRAVIAFSLPVTQLARQQWTMSPGLLTPEPRR
jgi:hypothetical protein